MENFNVVKAVEISKDSEGGLLDKPYYQLTLANSMGDLLTVPNEDGEQVTAPIRVSTSYINNLFNQEKVEVENLTARQMHRLIKSLSIQAVIEQKLEGDEFIATEFSNPVNVGTKAKPKWETPTKGQSYIVQESGYRVNYDHDFIIEFDDDLADSFAIKNARLLAQADA